MLSKKYTLSYVESMLRVLVDEIGKDKIQPRTVKKIINLKTLALAQLLNGAQDPFYQKTVSVNLAASDYTSTLRTSKTISVGGLITDTAHGLTSADVGKRIALFGTAAKIGISVIISVPSVDTIQVSPGLGALISGTLTYGVLSQHDGSVIDLSSYSIANIVKLEDSVNGIVTPCGNNEISGIADLDDNSESVFYNQSGEEITLVKGANVSSWGSLNLTYNRNPDEVSASTDYIDMKDEFVPLLIDMCKLDMYQLANVSAPPALSTGIENKTQALREAAESRELELKKLAKGQK